QQHLHQARARARRPRPSSRPCRAALPGHLMKRGHTMTTLPATGPVTSPPRPPADLRMTPGRRATLAIGVPIALVLIGWSAFILVASIGQASYPVSATIPVQNGRVAVSTVGGDITVHQGQVSGGTAHLTGKVEYMLVCLRFAVAAGAICMKCVLSTCRW